MRVVYILTSLGVGGAERQVLWLARRMAQAGHAVLLVILLPRGADDLLAESASETTNPSPLDVMYLGIRKRPWSALRGLSRGAAAIRQFRPDLIHAHNFHGNLAGRLLGLLCGGVPLISTIHNVYEGGWSRMLAYRMTDPLSRRTIAVSEAARERYVRLRAVSTHKAGVLANGIETANFLPDANRRNAMRRAMGVTEREFVWIAVGRLVPAKDYPNLLRAFSILQPAQHAAQLWIVGSGEPFYSEELRAQAQNLGIDSHIRWLGARQDVPALLDASDAFILASAWEGMPLALGEAMAMAKPVVATEAGGVAELAGNTGWLVPAGNSSALAETMARMMVLSDADRLKIGEASRTRVLEQFSMDVRAREWEEIYSSVLQ
jgi:glycosyltransferase involved in cell wall biosynthesis